MSADSWAQTGERFSSDKITTSMAQPVVSVIIPCFNQGRFLRDAVASVLAQSYRSTEIIVVNDGSTDETAQVAASFGERVGYVEKRNAGLSAARNTGILHATGEFVQFLDADDYLLPDSLGRFMASVEKETDGDVYFGSWDVVEEDRRVLRRVKPEIKASEDFLHRYLRGNVFPCHAAIVRRAALANSNLFDTQLRSFEDWDLWIRLAAAGARFVPAEGAVVAYRQHPGSMSKHYDQMWLAGATVLAKATSHAECLACRAARSEGWRSLRYHLYVNLLKPELRMLRRNKGLLPMTKRLWHICVTDPGIASTVLRLWIKQHLKRWRNVICAGSHSSAPAVA